MPRIHRPPRSTTEAVDHAAVRRLASRARLREDRADVGKPAKLLLGAATAWQLVYAVFFTAPLLRLLSESLRMDPDAVAPLDPLLAVHAGTALLMVALAAWYVADAARSPRVPPRRRALWIALNVVLGFLAQLVYWWAFVWREPEPLATTLVTPSS